MSPIHANALELVLAQPRERRPQPDDHERQREDLAEHPERTQG